MSSETPKLMKKAPRNVFEKVGRKLEKFEQKLGLPNSMQSSVVSLDDFSTDIPRRSSDSDETASIHSTQSHGFHTPMAIIRNKHAHRYAQQVSLTPSYEEQSTNQFDYEERDSTTQYDREMQIVCQELLEEKPVNLYDWRAYDKKVSLLRTAVSFNTPKVTGPVILFLENTLSKSIFYDLIRKYPAAMKSYLNLIKLRPDKRHHLDVLQYFGRSEDVAMIHLHQIQQTKDIKQKISQLDQTSIELSSHPWWQSQVAEYQHLIYKQQELQTYLSSINSTARLENRTVLDTYKIIFEKDFRRQKQNRTSNSAIIERSQELESAFHMSREMIMCGKLSVIMQCGYRSHYDDFYHQAVHQGFLGKKYVIKPEYLSDMVYNWVRLSGEGEEKAIEKSGKFVSLISDPQKRIYYAERFQNYDIAMDTIVHVLRDRDALENLRRRIPQDHPSYQRATHLLENTRWRN